MHTPASPYPSHELVAVICTVAGAVFRSAPPASDVVKRLGYRVVNDKQWNQVHGEKGGF